MAGLDFSVTIQHTDFNTAEGKKVREIAVFLCIFYWGYETLDVSKETKYTPCIKLMASGYSIYQVPESTTLVSISRFLNLPVDIQDPLLTTNYCTLRDF